MRDRIAEQRKEAIAKFFRNMAAHFRHCGRSGIEISADELAPVLSIQLRRDACRVY